MNRIVVFFTIIVSVLFVIVGITHAAVMTFDDLIFGETQYFFDSDDDGLADVIFSTDDPGGYRTTGPGFYMSYIQEPGLEGTSSLPTDLRVDFLLGAESFLEFGFALCSYGENSNTWTAFDVYDADGNLLDSDFEYGKYTYPDGTNIGNFPEGIIETSFTGVASYALFNFSSTGCIRYIIDNFEIIPPTVPDVDLLGLDLQEDSNEMAHHSDKYEPIVFRRASKLTFNVVMTPGFDINHYVLSLKVTGPNHIVIAKQGNYHDDLDWYVSVGGTISMNEMPSYPYNEYEVVPITVFVPYEIPIGQYEFAAILTRNHEGGFQAKEADELAYIIFNPWSQLDDDVYNASFSEQELHEYVLNDDGVIYKGNSRLPWGFDQYENDVFKTTINKVEHLPVSERSKAWRVARHLSAVTNDYNDNGILVGKWCDTLGCYLPYHSPNYWSGSNQIFKDYTGIFPGPVKYGQCWVFGGVLNSMSRTIGIPTRVVTTISSAHDISPYDGIINIYFRTDGERLTKTDKNNIYDSGYPYPESIWNFHVWNEAWLNRPDRNNYNLANWQAFDGTPQEISDGLVQGGPAPVAAIKADAGGVYDVDFIRHEVQADIVYWMYHSGSGQIIELDNVPHRSDHIYTVDPSDNTKKQDLLNEYCTDCPQTSSLVDRFIFAFLIKPLNFVFEFFSESADAAIGVHQVSITLTDSVKMGGNAIGSVQINNTGGVDDTVDIKIVLQAESSRGDTIAFWGGIDHNNISITAGNTINLPFNLPVPVTEGVMPSADFYAIKVIVIGAQGTGFGEEKGFITGHSLTISATPVNIDGQSAVTATIKNTLPIELNNVSLILHVPSEVQVLSTTTISIGILLPGNEVSEIWDVLIPIGRYNITVEGTVDGLAPIYGNTFIVNAGPAKLKLQVEAPAAINTSENQTVNVVISNVGGNPATATVTVKSGEGLGSINQTFQVNNLEGGASEVIPVTIYGTQLGSHSIVVLATMAQSTSTSAISSASQSNSTTHATAVVSVVGQPVHVNIILNPDSIMADQTSNIDLQLNTDALTDTEVRISSLASSADKRYAIFDGSERILSLPVIVPPTGKTLNLFVSESPSSGWIRINATPLENPVGGASADLIIESMNQLPVADSGGPYTGTVGNLVIIDASGSYDPDGNIVLYECDWDNDGVYDESSTSPIMTHTWSSTYSGDIILRVTDNDGLTSTAVAHVEITAEPEIINPLITFIPIGSSYSASPDTTGCPTGFVGKFNFDAELTNVSTSSLSDQIVRVTTLTNGNLLQNADGGPGGVGAELTVPFVGAYSDGILSPGESVDVPFSICLKQWSAFNFFVDVWGTVH